MRLMVVVAAVVIAVAEAATVIVANASLQWSALQLYIHLFLIQSP